MLDQNTDRMWYVIGAVIIGAAIILLLNNTFPQLFASVGETFKDKTESTTEVVDGIYPIQKSGDGINLLKDSDTFGSNFPRITFDKDAWHYITDGGVGRTNYLASLNATSYAFAFQTPSVDLPDANAYIHDVFVESDTYYTFSFVGDRIGYSPVEYAIYFGDQLVDTVVVDASTDLDRVSFTAKSPKDLDTKNYIKIRSNHETHLSANAFWMTQPKLEVGREMTKYSLSEE